MLFVSDWGMRHVPRILSKTRPRRSDEPVHAGFDAMTTWSTQCKVCAFVNASTQKVVFFGGKLWLGSTFVGQHTSGPTNRVSSVPRCEHQINQARRRRGTATPADGSATSTERDTDGGLLWRRELRSVHARAQRHSEEGSPLGTLPPRVDVPTG